MPALVSLLLTLVNLVWVSKRFKETLPEDMRQRRLFVGQTTDFQLFQSPNAATRRTNLTYLIYMLAFSGMEFTLTFLAVERLAFPLPKWRYVCLCGFILILVQGGIVRRMAPRLGEKRLALTGLACGIVALQFSLSLSKLGVFFLALGAMAFSIGLVSPTMSALVSLYSSEETQGRELGVFRSAGSLARAIGPLAAAGICFALGSSSAYLFGAILVIVPCSLCREPAESCRANCGRLRERSQPGLAGKFLFGVNQALFLNRIGCLTDAVAQVVHPGTHGNGLAVNFHFFNRWAVYRKNFFYLRRMQSYEP